jgi:predicted nuclease with RNAse H fold
MPTVVGVDLAAGRGVTAVAALRLREAGLPAFEPTEQGVLATDAKIVTAVASFCPIVVAIDAPLTLPHAVTAALLGSVPPASAEPVDPLQASPYTRAAERDPLWSRLGVRPLPVSFLGGLTFRAIALLPRLRAALPGAAIVEVFPSATLAALGIARSQPGGPRQRKNTPTARLAVQQALARLIAGLPAPVPEPLGADALDALAAALTAAAYASDEFLLAGDPAEGQIVVPRPR